MVGKGIWVATAKFSKKEAHLVYRIYCGGLASVFLLIIHSRFGFKSIRYWNLRSLPAIVDHDLSG